ncbi:MAG: 50S ribosomal protein L7 [Oscillospiraceae bacterium]|nr:50S ribosomal protein L7 [Oscillospiraceae bacterium]
MNSDLNQGKVPNCVNTLNTLGLCKRAGKIVTGFDAVVSDIAKAAGILIASDLSEKSKKEIAYHCNKNNKTLVETDCTMSQIEGVLNKRTGIIAILDGGLFKSLSRNY